VYRWAKQRKIWCTCWWILIIHKIMMALESKGMFMLCFVVFSLLGFLFSFFLNFEFFFYLFWVLVQLYVRLCNLIFFDAIIFFDWFSIMGFVYNGELNGKDGDLGVFSVLVTLWSSLLCSLALRHNKVGECVLVLLRDMVGVWGWFGCWWSDCYMNV